MTTTPNKNHVPKKQWRKWSNSARSVFNEVYFNVRHNTDVLYPPKAQNLPAATVKVMAWNTAWIAADAVPRVMPVKFS